MVSASINPNHLFLAEEDGAPRGVLYSPALMNADEKAYDRSYLVKPYYWNENGGKVEKRDDVVAMLVVYLEMLMVSCGQKETFEKTWRRYANEEAASEFLHEMTK